MICMFVVEVRADHLSCAFVRATHAVDLLAELDYDKSMGQMHMDETSCGVSGCKPHWIIENRGLAPFTYRNLESTCTELFVFLSRFNSRQVPTLT
jgi:hypothetical protein